MTGKTTPLTGEIMSSHPPASQDYQAKLIAELEDIGTWEKLEGWNKQEAPSFLMIGLTRLFLEYFQYHLEEAKECGRKHAALLKQAKPLIEKFIRHEERPIESPDAYDDTSERACWLRTNIAAFETMFGEITGDLEAEFIKEYFERTKDKPTILPMDAPDNMPRSHYWWF